jgi:hypothetical protein
MYLITVSLSIFSANKTACFGFAPPFPAMYKFHPPSTAINPKSFPRASAHSRMQAETPPFNLCGERIPLYLFSCSIANQALSSIP